MAASYYRSGRDFEQEERIIQAVRNRRPLWDSSTPLHKNVRVLMYCWQKIAEELNLDEKVVRKRWKGMRDYFFRQVKELEKNGVDAVKNNVTILWPLFDSLTFLVGTKTNTHNSYQGYKLTDEEREMIEEVTEYDKKQRFLLSCLKSGTSDTVSPDSTPKNSPVQASDELNQCVVPSLMVINPTSNTLQDKDTQEMTNKITHSEPPPLRVFIQGTNALKPQNQAPPTKKFKSIPYNDPGSQTIPTDTETDADLHFFKSLLPFMRALPLEDKLRVRNGIHDLILGELEAIRVKDSLSMTTQYHEDDSCEGSHLNPRVGMTTEFQLHESATVKEEIDDNQYLELEVSAGNLNAEDDDNYPSI